MPNKKKTWTSLWWILKMLKILEKQDQVNFKMLAYK
jgi:hypothetical protein